MCTAIISSPKYDYNVFLNSYKIQFLVGNMFLIHGNFFAFLAFGFLIYGTYISVISDFVSRIQNLYMPHYKCYMWNGSFVFCVLNSLTTQSLSCFPVATTYDCYRTPVMYVHAKGTIKCT